MSEAPREDVPAVPFREALRVWARVGLLSFGGPAAQIATMHRILVDEKKWVTDARFLHALNYCMLLPGPEATQLATYVGWLLHGTRGGLAAGLLFILPGFVALLALSIVYAVSHDVAFVAAMFWGLQAAVLAIVLEAVHRVGRRALHRGWGWCVAGAAFVLLFFFAVPFPVLVALAALTGVAGARFFPRVFAAPGKAAGEPPAKPPAGSLAAATAKTVALWLAIWWAPVLALLLWLGASHVLVREGLFFSKAAMVTFGGAYAVLPYVAQQAVEKMQWLAPDEMMIGLSLAETTPGPLIMVLQFVGFLGAFHAAQQGAGLGAIGAVHPLVMGTLGAAVSVWTTFAPCFLWIFAGAPFIERTRSLGRLGMAMSAVTAAVVGVILNLAVWFALHTLFAKVGEQRVGPGGLLRLYVPEWATFDWRAATLALAAAVLLLRFRVGMAWTLVCCTLAGLAWRWLAS